MDATTEAIEPAIGGDAERWVPMHRREVLVDVARRMLELHLAGATTFAPEVASRSVDIYGDAERAERERRDLFRSRPLVAALSGQVRQPGDHVVLEVDGLPLVIVRGDDGRARAFLNACRHRGAPVAEGAGCAARFTCQYHGWTYDTEGTLVGLPGAEGFEGLASERRNLVAVPTEERHGVIWVVPDPTARPDLDRALLGLDAELAELQLGRLEHLGTDTIELACNWHVALDTATESYHFLRLHWESIGAAAIGNLNVVDHVGDAQRVAYAGTALGTLAELDEADWVPQDHIQFVYLLFPNTALVVTSTYVVGLMQVFPGPTPTTCRVTLSSFTRDLSPTGTDPVEAHRGFWSVVVAEDFPMAEAIQRSMPASAHSSLSFGRNEPALQHLHRRYDEVDAASS